MGAPRHDAGAESAVGRRFSPEWREVRTPIDAILGQSHLLEMGLMGRQDFG
jgi:hypothetical protein